MLSVDLPPVVGVVLSTKQKLELWIVPLLGHRHSLKLWPIPSNKCCELVDNGANLLVCIEKSKTTGFHTLSKTCRAAYSHGSGITNPETLQLHTQLLLVYRAWLKYQC